MTTAQLVRRYLWDTQIELVVCGVLTSIIGILFAMIGDSVPLLFFSYLVSVGYMSLKALDIQDTYMSMYNIMPIHAKIIVAAHYNYYFAYCSIFGSIFVLLLLLYSALSQQFSLSLFIGMLLLTLCVTFIFGNTLFWLHYRFQKASSLFLAVIMLLFMFGGYRSAFDLLQNITYTTSSLAILSILSIALFMLTRLQINYSVKLFEKKDFA